MKNKSNLLPYTIIILLMFIFIFCSCNNKKVLNKSIKNSSEIKVDELLKYKNSYVGDNSKVLNIISLLPGNNYRNEVNLQTNNKPYVINITYMKNKNLEEDYKNFWGNKNIDKFLQRNAVVLLSLIPNADIVEFNVEGINNNPYKYTRHNLESKYGGNLKNLTRDKTSFENFLNKY
ncbi:DUF4825 domain-containing protein [Clostridium niameyense]|uniref:DUF4825 domain-containing protein n=1 Tax=Clostridium niameyense TaxID=1622073 RepID=A0A6M0R8B6_9CLOT|nr:DUF4825 domain-containing protein [Clostridium niameyense]NEZ46482.1 DUF4825 domain-containing protein [Clostridium niameyense]